ncbi:SulP family inorganic anion transporter [Cellulosilyticum ruminicola]|uniref:SulP family inorganic anion transporter n=1 Tax=Cellulosilyticum ruminicola TaxID=425254 RepID=UPI000AFB8E2F|nr:SulP family inorganic anion transporter [Cellulosilyticum ruminicola]
MIKQYILDIKNEFAGYNGKRFSNDLLAGLTVTAVALPLALAFGVSSGADAAAGLITAILSGLVMSALSGASYQISGPTGAMTAILIGLVHQYQMKGVFIATLLAGIILLIAGILKVGKLVSLIPAPVITGFTSGIAIIIALGQVDNFFGVTSEGSTAIEKLLSYGHLGFTPNMSAVLLGGIVIVTMIIWPKKWNAKVPSSLVGIIVALVVSMSLKMDVAVVGNIPKTLLPDTRLGFKALTEQRLTPFIVPAISIAALGMIESLLCGASAGRMKNEKLNADRELVAQGIGNILIPFFGGVPSTAAIARTSVAIKSGAETRLTGVFHAVGLLASMFLLGGVMSQIPLAALAGVLMVTAWRMNEWESIKYIFEKKLKTAISQFLITMVCTVLFDLTTAILVGVLFSVILFVVRIADIEINLSDIDVDKLIANGIDVRYHHRRTKVIYLSGPIFFATTDKLSQEMENLDNLHYMILSMRGVPLIDTTGVQMLAEMSASLRTQGTKVLFAGYNLK